MKHTFEIKVRTYECDSYNHVNNAVYLNYLEYARMQYLDEIGFDYKGVVEAGYHMYVTEIDIKYKTSAVFGDVLHIEVIPVKLKKISGEFFQIVKKADGTICAEARVIWACVDSKTGRPSKLPDEFFVTGLQPED